MRKLAAAALAVPVIAFLYLPVLSRRLLAGRAGIGVGIAAIAGILAVGMAMPDTTQARPPVAVTQLGPGSLAGRIEADHGLRAPIRLGFSEPMDDTSVAEALSVSPSSPVDLAWDATGRQLTITPRSGWKPATYYTITIAGAALDRTGRRLASPARAVFTTRGPIGARITATDALGSGRTATSAAFVLTYDGPVDVAAAKAAFRVEPAVEGTFSVASTAARGSAITFTPTESLDPNTSYTASVGGSVADADGVVTATPTALRITTSKAPGVVRFRPLDGAKGVTRGAPLSVRFTARMDRKTTAAAFTARVGATRLKGTISWAERDTVLVFQPRVALGYGVKVVIEVAGSALDRLGTPIGRTRDATFTTEAKPVARPLAVAKKATIRRSSGGTVHIKTGGGSVGAGSWHAVETYYLRLMNCTRGGGWVTSGGDCSSPGGSGISPLILSGGISDRVARPYAKYLATTGICDHFAKGSPGDRLHRAGYPGDYRENIGCRGASNPYASVLGTHLYFQTEKPCGGYCHYANMMSTKMKYVGIGVWVSGSRVRLVVDFWEG